MKNHSEHIQWSLSALFYQYSYYRIAHLIDEDLFQFLGDHLQNAVVADCGCGPGVVTEKFITFGAAKVYAVDESAAMLHQVEHRLAQYIHTGRVETIQKPFTPDLFLNLADHNASAAPNIVLFKRSLYGRPERTQKILAAAYQNLAPHGILAVVHPERSLKRYAFGPRLQIKPYTTYHLFNRTISSLAAWFHVGQYTLYDQAGLIKLMRSAIPDGKIEKIPTRQSAFNMVAAVKP